jgi:hypothetical protein
MMRLGLGGTDMTIKTISGSYSNGYTLAPAYNGVDVTNTGSISGAAGQDGTTSYSRDRGSNGGDGGLGLVLPNGGSVTNSGAITGGKGGAGGDGYVTYVVISVVSTYIAGGGGYGGAGGDGVQSAAFSTITNFGTITGGAGGAAGENLGPDADKQSPASSGANGNGIDLMVGGNVTNYGTIEGGGAGIHLGGAGTVVNRGTIQGNSGPAVEFDVSSDTLIAYGGSTLLGGTSGGGGSLHLMGGASVGTVEAIAGFGSVTFADGAKWDFKGANSISTGLTVAAGGELTIDGSLVTHGSLAGSTTVNGTLEVQPDMTLSLQGGSLSNYSRSTLTGVTLAVDPGSTLQLPDDDIIATLESTINLEGPGSVVQALKTSTSTLVSVEQSLKSIGATGTLTVGRDWSSGLAMSNAGTITLNGTAFTAKSLLNTGMISGSGTIAAPTTSAGTIFGGTFVFEGPYNSFAGFIAADSLRLAAGTTTLSTLSLFRLSVLGTETFDNAAKVKQNGIITFEYGTIINESSATWNMANGVFGSFSRPAFSNAGLLIKTTGPNLVHMSADFVNTGTIAITSGAIDFTGSVVPPPFGDGRQPASSAMNTFGGSISGMGTLVLGAGTNNLNSGLALTVAHVTVQGATTTVKVNEDLVYLGQWVQTGGSVSVSSGHTLTLRGSDNSLSGTITGPGTLSLYHGSDTLKAVTLSAATMTINNAAVTLQGPVVLSGLLTATAPNLIVAAGGATLSGGGTLALTNVATNSVHGATTTTARLNNYDVIEGAGQLGGGSMVLFNYAAGSIIGNGTKALVIDTGAQTISNTGLIEAASNASAVIKSAITNNGTLEAKGGTLTIDAAVAGTGKLIIDGGLADFASIFKQNVTFVASAGELELADSQHYTGTISGFSKTGASELDLTDIGYVKGTTQASFAGNTTSGVLTISDGIHTAKIKLAGDYTGSTWTLSSDGHGGTKVVDPTAPAPAMASFVAAMATFGSETNGIVGTPSPAADSHANEGLVLTHPLS